MDVESLKKQLQLMEILVDGCKKHPAYRAIRPATGNCEPCGKMWDARRELNEGGTMNSTAEIFGNDTTTLIVTVILLIRSVVVGKGFYSAIPAT